MAKNRLSGLLEAEQPNRLKGLPDAEIAFGKWYSGHARNLGLNPNPDDPRHFYDYRAAFRAGAEPDETGHFPSKFKLEGHPRLVIDGVDTRTGKPANRLAGLTAEPNVFSSAQNVSTPVFADPLGLPSEGLVASESPVGGPKGKKVRPFREEALDGLTVGLLKIGSAGAQAASSFFNAPGTYFGLPIPSSQRKEQRQIAESFKEKSRFLHGLSQDPDLAMQNTDAFSKLVRMATETGPYIAMTTGATILGGPFGTIGAFTVGSLVEGNNSYQTTLDFADKMEAEGDLAGAQRTRKMAPSIAIGVGLFSGAIESVGGGIADNVLKKLTARFSSKIIRGGLTLSIGSLIEGLEEAGQELTQITGETKYRDVNWDEVVNRTLQAGAGGVILGGVFRGASVSARRVFGPETSAEVPPISEAVFPVEPTKKAPESDAGVFAEEIPTAGGEVVATLEHELSTVEGRKKASISMTTRATEIAKKLGFDVSSDELFTTVFEGKHTRGTSHGDAGISLFIAKDATQEQIDRVLIHELGHTMKPPTEKGISNQHEHEKATRKFEEEQIAKLKAIEAKPVFAEKPVDAKTVTPGQKLISVLQTTKPVQKFVAETRHAVMQKKVGEFAKELEAGTGEEAFRSATRKLRGALPSGEIAPLTDLMSPAELHSIVEQLRNSDKLLPLEKKSAFGGPTAKGLWGLIHEGQIPQPKQVELLEREFKGISDSLAPKRPFGAKVAEAVIDVANLPRTFLTAYDLSASLRQTFISGTRHPLLWSKSFTAQVKAFASEKNALAIQTDIRGSKYYPDAVRAGLYLPDVASASGPLSARPEEFTSRFARAIPGVKASERAFITMGNKMRFELFSKYANMWEGTGKTVGDFQQLAKYLNAVTGRGSLGILENQGAALSAFLFSPRYLTSRFQILVKAAQAPAGIFTGEVNPTAKIAAGDLASFVALNLAVLATAKMFWPDDVDVELNPQSSDFAKLRIGKSRFELWAGFQPLMKYAARIITGQSKSAVTGNVRDVEKIDVAARFLRSKLAPVPAFIVDLKTGTSFIGDEVTVASLKKLPPENLAFQRFFPLAGQEIVDAFVYQGGTAAWLTVPAATLGVGVGSWDHSAFQLLSLQRDELANKYYGDKWQNIGPNAQKQITRLNPELDQLARQAKFDRKSFAFVGDILDRDVAAGREVASRLPSIMQSEMNRLKVSIGNIPQSIGTFQLNDERFEEYKSLIADELKKSDLIKGKSYKGISDKFKIRRLEAIIKKAKDRARTKIRQKAIRKDFQTRTEEPIFRQ